MGIILGGVSASDLILDGKSVSLYVGGNPPIKVWPTAKEVVQITLDTGWGARNQLLAALTARGLKYWTITEIPFEIELVGTGSAQAMFDGCSSLTSVPDLDTAQVTDMRSMFFGCSSLTSVPAMDTSNVTSMEGMFSGCAALVSVPDMDTSNVTSMAYMFANCAALTTAPEMDTAKVTTMSSMFDGCSALTYVPEMDTRNVTDTNYMLYGCSALTDGNVRLYGKHPQVVTWDMITASGLTKEPFIEVVQITLGNGTQARDQLRAALSARGLDYRTAREVPFEIELVCSGSTQNMFQDCRAITTIPKLDTSQVTNMYYMFFDCRALTSVPDLDTAQVTNTVYMFRYCSSLTDGNVRLIGRHPNVSTTNMIDGSGLTREPFYTADGAYEVSLTDVRGSGTIHPLVPVTVPAGETWNVRIQGTITKATSISGRQPEVKIGGETFGPFWQGDTVDCSGTVTSANNTIAIHTVVNSSGSQVSFVGTVTIET